MADVNGIDHLVPHDEKKTGYDNYGFHLPDTLDEKERLESVVTEDCRIPSPTGMEELPMLNSNIRTDDEASDISGNGVLQNHQTDTQCSVTDENPGVNTESCLNNMDNGYEHFVAIANEAKILNNETQITIPDDAIINFNTGRVRVKKNNLKSNQEDGEEKIPLEKMESSVPLSCNVSEKALEAQNNDSQVQNGVRNSTDSTNSTVPVANPLTSEKLIQQSNGTRKTFEEYFIPVNTHKKFIRGEKLYLMKDNRKLCHGWRRVIICGFITIIIAIAILVGVLAAARILIAESENKTSKQESGLLLPDRASISQEGSSLKPQPSSQVPHKFLPLTTANLPPKTTLVVEDEGVSQATSSEVNTKVPSVTSNFPHSHTVVPNALVGEFTITDENFTDDLKDNSSAEYQRFSEHLESELKRIFLQHGGEFESLHILSYRPGSIIVNFVVIWRGEQRIILAKQALGILRTYLKNHNGLFLVFQVNETSVKFTDVIDECNNQNGGCSYKCVWSYLSLSKICICPHHMELMQDGKSCGIILSTTSSTISEMIFHPSSPVTEVSSLPETSDPVTTVESELPLTAEVTTPNQEASASYSPSNTSPPEAISSEESTSPISTASTGTTGKSYTDVIVRDNTNDETTTEIPTEIELTTSETESTTFKVVVRDENQTPITTYTDTIPPALSKITTTTTLSQNETFVTTEISTAANEEVDTSETTHQENVTEIFRVTENSSEHSLVSELIPQTPKIELTTTSGSTSQTTDTFEPKEVITTPEIKETDYEIEPEALPSSPVDEETATSTFSSTESEDHEAVTKIFTLARETVETLAQEAAIGGLPSTITYVNSTEGEEEVTEMIPTAHVNDDHNNNTPEVQFYDNVTEPLHESTPDLPVSEINSPFLPSETSSVKITVAEPENVYTSNPTDHMETSTHAAETMTELITADNQFMISTERDTEPLTNTESSTGTENTVSQMTILPVSEDGFTTQNLHSSDADITETVSKGPDVTTINTNQNRTYTDVTARERIISTEQINWYPTTENTHFAENITTITTAKEDVTATNINEDSTITTSNEDMNTSDSLLTETVKTESTTSFSHTLPDLNSWNATSPFESQADTTETSTDIINTTTTPGNDGSTVETFNLTLPVTEIGTGSNESEPVQTESVELDLDNTTSTLDSTTLEDYIYENGTEYNASYPYEDMNASIAEDFNATAFNMSSYEENGNFSTDENMDISNGPSSELITNSVDCKKDQFRCEELNICINRTFVCDGIIDCPDKSDESNCEANCDQNFRCPNTTQCIINSARCDGIWDCEDGADEENCIPTDCAKHEVMCSDGSRCIKPVDICNGNYDCKDRSDEVGCLERTTCESGNRFFCNDGLCIPRELKCDGIKDCKENEDEANCTCTGDDFQCYDGKCLRSSSRCDGFENCKDGSDEMGCVTVDENNIVSTYEPYTGSWSLLCADDWTLDDGRYLCQELGFGHAVSIEKHHVSFNGSWMAMKRDNSTFKSLWTERVTFKDICSSNLAAAVTCQTFSCGQYSGLLHRRRRQVESFYSPVTNWPFIAYVSTLQSPVSCFSVILTPMWLITSFECLKKRLGQYSDDGSPWYVRTIISKEVESDLAQKHEVLKIIVHPHSSKFRSLILRDYNVALIRLKHALVFDDKIGAICLGNEQVPSGITCFTGVLGTTKPRAPPPQSPLLSSLPLMVVERETCNTVDHYNNQVDERMLCTKSSERESICDNDEGTPLTCLSGPNEWYLAGMLTYQHYCGVYKSHPPVFSNIFAMRTFIDQVTGQKQYEVPYDNTMYAILPPTTPGPTEITTSTLEITETNEKVIEYFEAVTSTLPPVTVSGEESNETQIEITTDDHHLLEKPTEETTIINSDVFAENATLIDDLASPNYFANISTEENTTTTTQTTFMEELSVGKTEGTMGDWANDTAVTSSLQNEYESVSQTSPQERNETNESSNLKQPIETESVFSYSGSSESTVLLATTSKMPNNATIPEIDLESENQSSITNALPAAATNPTILNTSLETFHSSTDYPPTSTVSPILSDAQGALEASTVPTSKQNETELSMVLDSSSHSPVISKDLSHSDDSMLSDGGLPYSHQATNIESPMVSSTVGFIEDINHSTATTKQTENTGNDSPMTLSDNIFFENTSDPDSTLPVTSGTTEDTVTTETAATYFDFHNFHGSRVIGESPVLVFSSAPNGETRVMEKLHSEPESGMTEEREQERQSAESREMNPIVNFFHSENEFATVKEQDPEVDKNKMETFTISPLPVREMTTNIFLHSAPYLESMPKAEVNLQSDPVDSPKAFNFQQDNKDATKEKETNTAPEISSPDSDLFLSTVTADNHRTTLSNEFQSHFEVKSDSATAAYAKEGLNNESGNQNLQAETEGLFREESGPTTTKDVTGGRETTQSDIIFDDTTRTYDTTVVHGTVHEDTCGNWSLKLESNETEPLAAGVEQWPSLGLLQMVSRPRICTSSILSSQWVLTSLSCLILSDGFLNADNWVFLGGLTDPNSPEPATQQHLIKKIIPHPGNWKDFVFKANDLALVMLKDKILFSPFSHKVCLPELPLQPNQQCFVAGWSKDDSGETTVNFQALPVIVVPPEECNGSIHYNGMDRQSVICIRHSELSVFPCQVDAGTPLFCTSKQMHWELRGVLPSSSNCDTEQTIIYNSLLTAKKWILINLETSEITTQTP